MGKKSPLVVIIPMNFNGATNMYKGKPILWHCLNSLKGLKYDNYTVLVSDGSTDNSVDYMRKHFPGVHSAVNTKIRGYTKAANFALRMALKRYNPDYIVMMDNDVIIKDKVWLGKMVDIAEADEQVGIVGSKNLLPDGRLADVGAINITPLTRNRARELTPSQQHSKTLYSGIEELDFVSSSRFLVKRRLIDTIGLYDENLYMGNEDTDYCARARRAGFKVVYDGSLSLIHLAGFTYKNIASKKADPDYAYPMTMTNEAYYSFKTYSGSQLAEALALIILRSFLAIGIEPLKLRNIKFKNKAWWRFRVCIGAIGRGYRLHKHQLTRDEAYGL